MEILPTIINKKSIKSNIHSNYKINNKSYYNNNNKINSNNNNNNNNKHSKWPQLPKIIKIFNKFNNLLIMATHNHRCRGIISIHIQINNKSHNSNNNSNNNNIFNINPNIFIINNYLMIHSIQICYINNQIYNKTPHITTKLHQIIINSHHLPHQISIIPH
jgi:hypothetical protein